MIDKERNEEKNNKNEGERREREKKKKKEEARRPKAFQRKISFNIIKCYVEKPKKPKAQKF